MQMECKYPDCGYSGDTRVYVGFFPQDKIHEAHLKDPYLPRYGFHLGIDCPKCRRWQKWLPQSDDSMLGIKFFAE